MMLVACMHPGCGLTTGQGLYCAVHRHKPRAKDYRPTSAVRGYDRRWRRFRRWYLARSPWCKQCGKYASEIHHVVPLCDAPERQYDEGNLVSLCKRCHSSVTNSKYKHRQRVDCI